MTPLIFNCHFTVPGRDSPGRHLLFLTGPRDSGSDPGRLAQLRGVGLLSLGVQGVSRMWGDSGASDMITDRLLLWGLVDGVGFALG
jgi:hypothetical protein